MHTKPEYLPPPLLRGFFSAEEAEAARVTSQPLMAAVFMGPGCLNACPYCCYGIERERKIQEGKQGLLTRDDYRSVLDEVADLGVKTVFIPGEGEPVLGRRGRDLLDLTRAVHERGMYTVVISSLNPTPTDEFVDGFFSMNASLIAKLESMDQEIFNKNVLPTKPYEFAETEEGYIPKGMAMLLEKGLARDGRLGSGTVLNWTNYHEAETIFRFYRKNNIFPYMQSTALYGRAANWRENFEGLNHRAIFERLREIDREEFGYDWDIRTNWVAFDFNYPMFIVENDGTIRYNSSFLVNMGKVKNGTFQRGYLTEAMRDSPLANLARQINFSIGKDKGCCPSDHAQCMKFLLKADDGMEKLNDFILSHPEKQPNDYCIFSSNCR